jgi:hypothetical protein
MFEARLAPAVALRLVVTMLTAVIEGGLGLDPANPYYGQQQWPVELYRLSL